MGLEKRLGETKARRRIGVRFLPLIFCFSSAIFFPSSDASIIWLSMKVSTAWTTLLAPTKALKIGRSATPSMALQPPKRGASVGGGDRRGALGGDGVVAPP